MYKFSKTELRITDVVVILAAILLVTALYFAS